MKSNWLFVLENLGHDMKKHTFLGWFGVATSLAGCSSEIKEKWSILGYSIMSMSRFILKNFENELKDKLLIVEYQN
ncbi:MAG: hypothetical protein ACLT64_10130 [Streptococcus salivarius]